jgi:site-specific DNA-adenine methylase
MPLVGLTVEEIQYSLRELLNVGMDAEAYLNGQMVIDSSITFARGGDRLEFMKAFGRKGGSPSPLRYPGGKGKKAARQAILTKRPAVVREYREPLVGSASLALRIDEYATPSSVWINDIDPHLIAFLVAMRDRPAELVDMCLSLPHYRDGEKQNKRKDRLIRELYEQAVFDEAMDPALRYFICNRVSWNGRVNYAMPSRMGCRNPGGWNVRAFRKIEEASPFMQGWRITCGDYLEVLAAPGKDVWCVVDGPYYKNTLLPPTAKLYRHNFDHDQHGQLAVAANVSENNLLICYDDYPAIRQLYPMSAGFLVFEEGWTYGGQSVKQKPKGKELVITNYRPRR